MIVSNRIYITVFVALILRALLAESLPHGHQEGPNEHHRDHQGQQRGYKGQYDRSRPHLQHGSKGVEESESSQIEQGSQQYQEFQQQHEGSQIHPRARHQVFQQYQVQEGPQLHEFQEQQQVTQHQGSQIHQGARTQEVQEQQESQTQQGPQYQKFQHHQGPPVHQGARYQEVLEQQEIQAHQGAHYQELEQHQAPQMHQTGHYQEFQGQQRLPAQQGGQYQEFQGVRPGARHQEFQGQQGPQQGEYQEFQPHQSSQIHQGARHQEHQHQGLQVNPGTRYQEFQPHQVPHVQQGAQYQEFPRHHTEKVHLTPQYQEYQGHLGARGPHRYYYHDGRRYYPQHHVWQRGYNQYHEPGYPVVYPSHPFIPQSFPYPPEHPDYQAAFTAYSQNQPHFYRSDGSKVKFTYIPLQNSHDTKIIIPGPGDRSNIKYVRISQDGDERPDENSVKQTRETGTSEVQTIEDNSVNQQKTYQEQKQAVSTASASATATSSGSTAAASASATTSPDLDQGSKRGKHKRNHGHRRSHIQNTPQSEDNKKQYNSAAKIHKHHKHSNKNERQQSDSKQDTSNSKEQIVTVINEQSKQTESINTNESSTSKTVKKETVVEPLNKPHKKHDHRRRKHSSHKQQGNEQIDISSDLRSQDTEKKVDSDKEFDEAAKVEESYKSTYKADTKEIAIESSNNEKKHRRRKHGSHNKYTDQSDQSDINSDLRSKSTEVRVYPDREYNEAAIAKESTSKTDTKKVAIESLDVGKKYLKHKHGSQIDNAEQSEASSDLRSQTTQLKVYSDRGNLQDDAASIIHGSKSQTTINSASQQYREKQSDRKRKHETYDKQTEVSEQSENNSDLRSQDTVQQESTTIEYLNEVKNRANGRQKQDTFEQKSESETNSDLRSQDTEVVLAYSNQQNAQEESEYGVTEGTKQTNNESENQQYIEELEQYETNSDLKPQDSETIAYLDQEQNQNESDTVINVKRSILEEKIANYDNEKEVPNSKSDEVKRTEHQSYGDDYTVAENDPGNYQDNDDLYNTSNNNEAIIAETTVVNENNKKYKDASGPQTVESYTPCEQDESSQTLSAVIDAESKNSQNNKKSHVAGKVLAQPKKDIAQESEQISEDEDSGYYPYEAYNNIENYAAAYSIAKIIASSALHGHDGVKKVFEDPAVKVYVQPLMQRFLPYYLHLKDIVEKLHKVPK